MASSSRSRRLEQWRLAGGRSLGKWYAKMSIGAPGGDPTSGRSIDETELEEKRLVDVHDRVRFFTDRGGDRVKTNWPSVELFDNRAQHLTVDVVEAKLVNFEHAKRGVCDVAIDPALGSNVGKVANALQQPIGDSRSSASASGDDRPTFLVERDAEDARRPANDLLERRLIVEVEPMGRAEPVAQRRAE